MKFSIDEAKKIQSALAVKVRIEPFSGRLRFICGVDAAFTHRHVIGVASLFAYPDITPVEDSHCITEVRLPYIPGYLSFREGPAIIKAIQGLKIPPDLLLFDGQGIAHPEGMGVASHVGVLLDIPSVGCAKSRLIGDYTMPGKKKGNRSGLTYHGKTVGAVVRTRDNVRPLFVSPGHRASLQNAVDITLACTPRYRIPEPLRRADRLTKELKRKLQPNYFLL